MLRLRPWRRPHVYSGVGMVLSRILLPIQGTDFILMFFERTAINPLVKIFHGMQSRGCYSQADLRLAKNVNQIRDAQNWME